jgi:response regulator RpfG family c-di-GMP phosphodiesterase
MEELKLPGGTGNLAAHDPRKTLLIFSPDLNLCFCLSMLFQDRFHVVTSTSLAMIEPLAVEETADVLIVDAPPSERLITQLEGMHQARGQVPVILLYAYHARGVALDRAIRSHVDSVFYKPVEIPAITRRIEDLLPR